MGVLKQERRVVPRPPRFLVSGWKGVQPLPDSPRYKGHKRKSVFAKETEKRCEKGEQRMLAGKDAPWSCFSGGELARWGGAFWRFWRYRACEFDVLIAAQRAPGGGQW